MLSRLIATASLAGLTLVGSGACALATDKPPAATVEPGSSATRSASSVLDLLRSDDGVLWLDAEKTHPMFISGRLLNGRISLGDIPVGEVELGQIEGLANPRSEAKESKPPICRMSDAPGIGRPREDALSFEKKLATYDLSFVGRVTSFESGLYLWGPANVVTLVHVKVDEVIRDDHRFLQPGRELRYLVRSGSISTDAGVICTESVDKVFLPRAGDRVFAMGASWPPDYRIVLEATVYPVSGNQILDIGYAHVRAPKTISLDDVRSLAEVAQGVPGAA